VSNAQPRRAAEGRRWAWWAFASLEVLAVLAVPILAVVGVRVLLDTRAGTYVTGPGPGDPGYQALVDPSPVRVLLERRDGVLTGVTVVSRTGADDDGGAVLLVPAEVQVEGQALADWAQAGDLAVADALARALRLRMDGPDTLDEGAWQRLLGDRTVTVANPDPVIDGDVERFPGGRLDLAAADLADWMGLLGNQEPSALAFRRELLWQALFDAGLDPGPAEPAATLARVAAGTHRVELLPLGLADGVLIIDLEEAEALVVDVVPFPAGSQPGDRLRVRVLDRTGHAVPDDVARAVARAGGEVVMVGNAAAFDGRPTEAVIADANLDEATRRLLDRLGTGTVTLSPGSDDTIDVTVLSGPDLLGRPPG
jgi:hypothetical protein